METRPTDERLLSLLLDATGDFVPGQKLQECLGVSRAAIYQCVERLAPLGLEIEARRHHGYRLKREPDILTDVLLRAYQPLVAGCPPLRFYPSVDSTNTRAEQLLAEGHPTPFVVLAREQTAGRGRRGRRWHSPDAGNLYASFAFRPLRPPREMPPLTLWLGMAVARVLRQELDLPVMVKWPNDLLLAGRKLAGMLAEARIDADSLRDLIFGLGLNLQADTRNWPEEVRAVATSVGEHRSAASAPPSWHLLVIRLLAGVANAYRAYLDAPAPASLLAEWPSFDALADRAVSVESTSGTLRGTARGIDASGQLRLETAEGTLHHVNAGEVSLGSASLLSAEKGD